MFVSLYLNISSLFLAVDFPLLFGILTPANDSGGVRSSVVFFQNTKGTSIPCPWVHRVKAPARVDGRNTPGTGSTLFNYQDTHGSQVLAWSAHHGQRDTGCPPVVFPGRGGRGSHFVAPSCLHPYITTPGPKCQALSFRHSAQK